jgi:hypothetical protein
MKKILTNISYAVCLSVAFTACTKNNSDVNAVANTATAASASLSLNNRVTAAFVKDSSTLLNVNVGTSGTYNKFRKFLTYDTIATTNKTPVYNVGDVINVIAFLKGDDSAIVKRKINFRFFQTPTSFITPTAINVMQKAEDSYRGFAPASADIITITSLPSITQTTAVPFEVRIVGTEGIGGINYTIYLVKLNYVIPATFSGKILSINFTANTAGSASDLGNVNWIYAFRVR